VNPDDLKVIADLTVRLTELRLKGCEHLCVENYAPEVFGKLLYAYQIHVEYKYVGSDQPLHVFSQSPQ